MIQNLQRGRGSKGALWVAARAASDIAATPVFQHHPLGFPVEDHLAGGDFREMIFSVDQRRVHAAVTRARSHDQAERLASHDGLTGALNGVVQCGPGEAAFSRWRRAGMMLLAYLDLNDLRSVNATDGRPAGDAAFKAVGDGALHAVRGSDLVGRLGGDEFGFLLNVAAGRDPQVIATQLRDRLTNALATTGLPLLCTKGAVVVPRRSHVSGAEALDAANVLTRAGKNGG